MSVLQLSGFTAGLTFVNPQSWKTNETSPMESDLFIPTHYGTLFLEGWA